MFDLSKEHFFNLECFSHPKLFNSTDIWNPLHILIKYLDKTCLGKIEGNVSPSSHLINPETIVISQGVTVEPGAYIKGPCFIGKGSVVRHGAYIRGYVVTGENCIIGHDTEIKHSILLNKVRASHFAYIGDSIIGNNVTLGAGVKCANLRLDQKEISIFFKKENIRTKLKKMGSILGDGVQIGCNAVLNPGTIMGPKSICYPCIAIRGIIPPSGIVKPHKQPIVKSNE